MILAWLHGGTTRFIETEFPRTSVEPVLLAAQPSGQLVAEIPSSAWITGSPKVALGDVVRAQDCVIGRWDMHLTRFEVSGTSPAWRVASEAVRSELLQRWITDIFATYLVERVADPVEVAG